MSKSKYFKCPLCNSNARYLVLQAFLKKKLKGRPIVVSTLYLQLTKKEDAGSDLRGVCTECFRQILEEDGLDKLGKWTQIIRKPGDKIEVKGAS